MNILSLIAFFVLLRKERIGMGLSGTTGASHSLTAGASSLLPRMTYSRDKLASRPIMAE